MATFVALGRRVLAEPPRCDNQIFQRWPIDESLLLTFLIHISIMKREQGLWVTSELHRGGGGQPSMARQGSRRALACRIPPQVLRICPGGSRAGINSQDLTELCCLRCVNMAVSHNWSLRRKQFSSKKGKRERPNLVARCVTWKIGVKGLQIVQMHSIRSKTWNNSLKLWEKSTQGCFHLIFTPANVLISTKKWDFNWTSVGLLSRWLWFALQHSRWRYDCCWPLMKVCILSRFYIGLISYR